MKAQVPTHCLIITFHQFQHSLASFVICGLFPHSSPSDSHSFILWPFNMQTRRNMVSDLMGSAFFCCCLFEFVLLPKTNVSGAPFNLACQTDTGNDIKSLQTGLKLSNLCIKKNNHGNRLQHFKYKNQCIHNNRKKKNSWIQSRWWSR